MILQLTLQKTKILQININYIKIILKIYKLNYKLIFIFTDKENGQDDQQESDREEEILNSDIEDFPFVIDESDDSLNQCDIDEW